MKISCDNCGKIKNFTKDKISRNKHFYCSQECYHAHRIRKEPKNSTLKIVKCDNCGAEIKLPKWKRDRYNHNFCCKECSDNWQSKNLIEEKSPFWKGGNDYRIGSKRWQQQRLRVRKRDNFKCVDCGRKENDYRAFDVHHLNTEIEDPNFLKDYNCITLCRKCHSKKHNL